MTGKLVPHLSGSVNKRPTVKIKLNQALLPGHSLIIFKNGVEAGPATHVAGTTYEFVETSDQSNSIIYTAKVIRADSDAIEESQPYALSILSVNQAWSSVMGVDDDYIAANSGSYTSTTFDETFYLRITGTQIPYNTSVSWDLKWIPGSDGATTLTPPAGKVACPYTITELASTATLNAGLKIESTPSPMGNYHSGKLIITLMVNGSQVGDVLSLTFSDKPGAAGDLSPDSEVVQWGVHSIDLNQKVGFDLYAFFSDYPKIIFPAGDPGTLIGYNTVGLSGLTLVDYKPEIGSGASSAGSGAKPVINGLGRLKFSSNDSVALFSRSTPVPTTGMFEVKFQYTGSETQELIFSFDDQLGSPDATTQTDRYYPTLILTMSTGGSGTISLTPGAAIAGEAGVVTALPTALEFEKDHIIRLQVEENGMQVIINGDVIYTTALTRDLSGSQVVAVATNSVSVNRSLIGYVLAGSYTTSSGNMTIPTPLP